MPAASNTQDRVIVVAVGWIAWLLRPRVFPWLFEIAAAGAFVAMLGGELRYWVDHSWLSGLVLTAAPRWQVWFTSLPLWALLIALFRALAMAASVAVCTILRVTSQYHTSPSSGGEVGVLTELLYPFRGPWALGRRTVQARNERPSLVLCTRDAANILELDQITAHLEDSLAIGEPRSVYEPAAAGRATRLFAWGIVIGAAVGCVLILATAAERASWPSISIGGLIVAAVVLLTGLKWTGKAPIDIGDVILSPSCIRICGWFSDRVFTSDRDSLILFVPGAKVDLLRARIVTQEGETHDFVMARHGLPMVIQTWLAPVPP